MRKQHVFLLAFAILALVISGVVYQSSKRQSLPLRDRSSRNLRIPAPTPLSPSSPSEPGRPPATPEDPTRDIQRTLKTIEEVQRINRLNRDMNKRPDQAPAKPASQKK
jgi:hypothetical protein